MLGNISKRRDHFFTFFHFFSLFSSSFYPASLFQLIHTFYFFSTFCKLISYLNISNDIIANEVDSENVERTRPLEIPMDHVLRVEVAEAFSGIRSLMRE